MFAKRLFQRTHSEAKAAEAKPAEAGPAPAPAPAPEEDVDGVEDAQDLPEEGTEVPAIPEVAIPEGNLTEDQLQPRLAVHQGIPATASILAFEPVQRVLAVASLDGRIKLFGSPGLEALLQSPLRAPCKYLEFVNNGGQLINVTTQNDIEVWNLETQEVVCTRKWDTDITAVAVLQGTSYMYLGDYNGTVTVLQFEESEQKLIPMRYCIPADITLGGIVRAGSSTAPSVVGILPQPNAAYSRLVVAYGNGLIVLWGLHETRVLAVRGGTDVQRKRLAEHASNQKRLRSFSERVAEQAATLGEQLTSGSSLKASTVEEEDEEEKEICTICWACQDGSTLAAGYVDGDIWLWNIPTIPNERGQGDQPAGDSGAISGTPVRRFDLVPGKSMKMPVILLKWCASGKGNKGVGGRLHVYGGCDLSAPQALRILSLEGEASEELHQLELLLHGSFGDMAMVPSPGGSLSTPVAAIMVLTSPGLLHTYDGAGIAAHFHVPTKECPSPSSLQPVPWQLPIREVVVAKLYLVFDNSLAAKALLQLPRDTKGVLSTLPAGTKWPITGGMPSSSGSVSYDQTSRSILVTGHKGGYVQVWDASTPSVSLWFTVEAQTKEDSAPVSSIVFCEESGLLAVGDQKGKVYVHKLSAEAQEVKCRIVSDSSGGTEGVLNASAGFQCIAALSVHQAAITTIAIASGSNRLAVGDESGMISLLDLATFSLLFFGSWPGNSSSISILEFATCNSAHDEAQGPSPPSDQPSVSPSSSLTVLYVANKDSTVGILDGSTGVCIGPGPLQSVTPSTTLYMRLLDATGVPITSLSSKQIVTQDESSVQPSTAAAGISYLMLCTENCLRLHQISAQGLGAALREVTLEHSCCWASTFQVPSTQSSGIILLYQSGHFELRSLPDLRVLKETTLTQCLSWQLEPSLSFLRTLTCATNGHIALIDEDRELVHLSLLSEENDLRLPQSLPQLFDKDLAAAAEAALKYASSLPKKKQVQTQGLLGVLKEIRSALDQGPAVHPASELPKLFSSQPFTVPAVQLSDLPVKTDSLGIDVDMDIDDILIDLEDMNVNAEPLASGESSSNKVVLHRVKNSPRGKEATEETTRSQLFGDDGKPRQRTADEIKAAYGHTSKVTDATSAAHMARDKLMERGEKLQSLNQRTEEMQEGAENFASMAEQLAKKYERRKWWQL